ncbi:MAG: type II secretion system protein [Methylomonas sp.]|nr:type II secretion system protein [Methylomonas sp.]
METQQFKRLKISQGGFTLLELLVVITLIAALAVGALIAYDGVGDKAQAAAGADANVKVDNAIRQYKAVTLVYPNQWDSLVSVSGTPQLLPVLPRQLLGVAGVLPNLIVPLTLSGEAASNVTFSFGRAGITELQYWRLPNDTLNGGVIPNLAHNESFNPLNAEEVEHFDNGQIDDLITNVAVIPSRTGCQASGVTVTPTLGTNGVTGGPLGGTNWIQNRFSDALEQDECHLVVALGFGSDAAASTTVNSSLAITKAPSFAKTDPTDPANNVNPNQHYSRYIGLFLVGSDGANGGTEDNNITGNEYLNKARLLTIIAPDGTIADQNLAEAAQR